MEAVGERILERFSILGVQGQLTQEVYARSETFECVLDPTQ